MNKKGLFSLMIAICGITGLFAQENMFSKGDKVANISIGLGSNLYSGLKGIPPIGASFEYGIKDNLFDAKSSLGVGGYAGFTTAGTEILGTSISYSSIILGARGLLHYQLVDKLDTYAGVLLGINIASSKVSGGLLPDGYGASGGGLVYAGFIGARYYFSPKFAAMAELGYGIALLNIGVSIKL
jgi:hypothetical protein